MAQPLSPAVRRLVDKINQPAERSKQVKIGPSEIGISCQLCLAERLLASHHKTPREDQELSVASWIGTVAHAAIESLQMEDAAHELQVTVGEIEGIGPITGSLDYYDFDSNQIIDFKFSSKRKISGLARAYTIQEDGTALFDEYSRVSSVLKQYYVQQMLYAKGVEESLHLPVDSVSLMLVPRDATVETFERGITELRFAYDKSAATAMLARASEILAWALANPDEVDDLESDPQCYFCNMQRGKQWI